MSIILYRVRFSTVILTNSHCLMETKYRRILWVGRQGTTPADDGSSRVYNIIMLMLASIGDEGDIGDDTENLEATDHCFPI